ncbi:mitochondrial 54S ribosomal protein uL10m [Apiospora kogelbergensis]|uniref:mitochondrial 54S ribosomal protein uL10m n=1 Tax=Apiospora kogelbergensis TaxID=1337665 RepID=UPI003130DA5C
MSARLNCSSARGVARVLRSQSANPLSRATATLPQISISSTRHYAAAARAAPISLGKPELPENYVSPNKPPTARRPETRKSQMIRVYTALLRSTPLMLFFQHNNLTAVEWSAVRRELKRALSEVPAPIVGPDGSVPVDIAESIQIQVLRTKMFDVAFKVVEFFDAEEAAKQSNAYTHDLSKTAYEAVKAADTTNPNTAYAQISPLLEGPVAALTFPTVSPAHLAAALKVLSPTQSGLQKLFLIGGRVEGKAFDYQGVRWVGGIDGGLEGLRSQLVYMLQSAGLGLTTALEGQSKGLWLALESRRTQLDEEQNPKKQEEGEAPPSS